MLDALSNSVSVIHRPQTIPTPIALVSSHMSHQRSQSIKVYLGQQFLGTWYICKEQNAGLNCTKSRRNSDNADCSDKQRVWVALSSWAKDIESGNRVLSWEVVKISKSVDIIADGINGFPNISPSD